MKILLQAIALSVYIFTRNDLKLQIYQNLIYNTRTNNFSTHNFYDFRCYMASSVRKIVKTHVYNSRLDDSFSLTLFEILYVDKIKLYSK